MSGVLGLDLSFTGTGWVFLDTGGKDCYGEIKTDAKNFGSLFERVDHIVDIVMGMTEKIDPELVIMEDYYVGLNKQVTIMIVVLGTVMRYRLLNSGRGYLTVAPTQVKKFLTGNGTAKKDNMLKCIYKKYNFDTNSNNLADACAIAHVGMSYLAYKAGKEDGLQKYELEVLKKIDKERKIELPYKKQTI